jgi:hypothetical protein
MAQRSDSEIGMILDAATGPGTWEYEMVQAIRQQERKRAAQIVRGWRENGLTENIGIAGFCRPSAAKIASAILDTPPAGK